MTKPVHDQDDKQKKGERDDAFVPAAGGDHTHLTSKPDADSAPGQIRNVLAGKGDQKDLPELFTGLSDADRAAYLADPDKLRVVSGDIAMRCLDLVGADAKTTLRIGLFAKPKASAEALRGRVVQIPGEELATATVGMVQELQERFPKLLDLDPLAVEKLHNLANNPKLLEWFIRSTDPKLVAVAMGRSMSNTMVEALDKYRLWTPWVDELRPTNITVGFEVNFPNIKDPTARAALEKVVGKKQLETSFDDAQAEHAKHKGDVHAAIAGKPTVSELMNAIYREGRVGKKDVADVLAVLEKQHATADDVLSLFELGVEKAALLPALLRAPGVSAHHVMTLLAHDGGDIALLADAKTRKAVRDAAPGLRLTDLLGGQHSDEVRQLFLRNDGLAAWFCESAAPSELMWFCAENLGSAAKACRVVGAKVGFGWVTQLTSLPTGDDVQLRILARNCHDKTAEDYIRTVLLGEQANPEKDAIKTSVPVAESSRSGAGTRLVETLSDDKARDFEVFDRLVDLEEGKRAKLGTDDAVVQQIVGKVPKFEFARAARLLDLSASRVIAFCPMRLPQVASYVGERPHDEQVAAIAKPDLLRRAVEMVHTDLLALLPALAEPSVLAAALHRDNSLMKLLLAGSDPDLVVELISRPPVLAAAEAIFDKFPQYAANLPKWKQMTKDAREGVGRLEKAAKPDSNSLYTFGEVKAGDAEVSDLAKERGKRLGDVEKQTLEQAIDTFGKAHEKGEAKAEAAADRTKASRDEASIAEVDAVALLRRHKAEVPELLTDRTKRPAVEKLAKLIGLPPTMAVPWIDPAQLILMPNALVWWMESADRASLLHALASSAPGRGVVAGMLSAGSAIAANWLSDLPKGKELTDAERKVLDALEGSMRSDATAMYRLFEARFGFPAPSSFSAKQLADLYGLVSRLPPGHITQGHITSITNPDLVGIDGQYREGQGGIEIDDDVKPGTGLDEMYTADMSAWHMLPNFKAMYHLDDARIATLQGQDRIITKTIGKDVWYRMTVETVDLFSQVVLHEIGHSVDEALGKRSAPVFDFAGWHQYTDGAFDEWAKEMGGWDKVNDKDRKAIREAWIDATRGKTTIRSLVSADHAALSEDYEKAGVGIVKSARADETMGYTDRIQHGDRVFIAGSYPNVLSSVKASAVDSAPSPYSLFAPAEYFAECYTEYYISVDGTPGSEAKKGGALPGPVRKWFDDNVDKVKFDPGKFKSKPSTDDKAAAKTA